MGSRHWRVRGRVQGVGFRAFVARCGRELELDGWVRNLTSGEVEVVAVGDERVLDELEEALRSGPRVAHVDGVRRLPADAGLDDLRHTGFVIRHDR